MKSNAANNQKAGFIFLDLVKLDTISSGNKETKSNILHAFVACMPPLLSALEKSLEEANPTAITHHLHKLKSSVGWMSVDKLIAYIQKAESSVWKAAAPDYRDEFNILLSATRMLTEEAKALRATSH